jgi:hypothetical protein
MSDTAASTAEPSCTGVLPQARLRCGRDGPDRRRGARDPHGPRHAAQSVIQFAGGLQAGVVAWVGLSGARNAVARMQDAGCFWWDANTRLSMPAQRPHIPRSARSCRCASTWQLWPPCRCEAPDFEEGDQAISRRLSSSAASRCRRSRLRPSHRPDARSTRRRHIARFSASGPTRAQIDIPRRT